MSLRADSGILSIASFYKESSKVMQLESSNFIVISSQLDNETLSLTVMQVIFSPIDMAFIGWMSQNFCYIWKFLLIDFHPLSIVQHPNSASCLQISTWFWDWAQHSLLLHFFSVPIAILFSQKLQSPMSLKSYIEDSCFPIPTLNRSFGFRAG